MGLCVLVLVFSIVRANAVLDKEFLCLVEVREREREREREGGKGKRTTVLACSSLFC